MWEEAMAALGKTEVSYGYDVQRKAMELMDEAREAARVPKPLYVPAEWKPEKRKERVKVPA